MSDPNPGMSVERLQAFADAWNRHNADAARSR